MPKPKKIIRKKENESPKKSKTAAKKSEQCETCANIEKSKKNTVDEEDMWALGKSRYVKVNQFLGDVYVDIRCYYYKDKAIHPSRAGIALTIEQWDKLKNSLGEIKKTLEAKRAKK